MHARLQITRAFPATPDPAAVRHVIEKIAGQPGFAGLYMMEQLGLGSPTLLTLWHSRQDADLAPQRTEVDLGPRPFTLQTDDVYELEDDWPGPAAAERPETVGMVYFDGPLSPAKAAAIGQAGRSRIGPTLARQPGLVRALALWHPEERKAVLACLAISIAALDASLRTINWTELLPGEEPVLLTGPDRGDLHRIVGHAAAPSAAGVRPA